MVILLCYTSAFSEMIYADFCAKILDRNFRLIDKNSLILVVVVVVFVTKINLFSSTKIFVFRREKHCFGRRRQCWAVTVGVLLLWQSDECIWQPRTDGDAAWSLETDNWPVWSCVLWRRRRGTRLGHQRTWRLCRQGEQIPPWNGTASEFTATGPDSGGTVVVMWDIIHGGMEKLLRQPVWVIKVSVLCQHIEVSRVWTREE